MDKKDWENGRGEDDFFLNNIGSRGNSRFSNTTMAFVTDLTAFAYILPLNYTNWWT